MDNLILVLIIIIILILVFWFFNSQTTEGFGSSDNFNGGFAGIPNYQMKQLRDVGSGRADFPIDTVNNSGGLATFRYTTINNRGGNGKNWIPNNYSQYSHPNRQDPFAKAPISELTNELIYGDYTQYPYYPTWKIEQPISWGQPQQSFQEQASLAAMPDFNEYNPTRNNKIDHVLMGDLPIMDLPASGELVDQLPKNFEVYGKYNKKPRRQSEQKKNNDYYMFEQFPMPFEGADSSDDNDAGIRNDRMDLMPCSKKCCDVPWTDPFDNLTSKQVRERMNQQSGKLPTVIMEMPDGKFTEFVKTNYNCGGFTNAGCPCVPLKAYKTIANRGNNTRVLDNPDPTFILKYGLDKIADDEPDTDQLTPYQKIQSRYSSFIRNRRINDQAKETPDEPLDLISGAPADF